MRHTLTIILIFLISACLRPEQAIVMPAGFNGKLIAPYQLDHGDRVRIIVYGQTDLSNIYGVDQGGYISMPLIGPVIARGQTAASLERIVASLLGKKYLRDPNVSVEVASYRPFFVMGDVKNSGQFAYVTGMTVENAIAIAGGFSERADRNDIQVTRKVDGRIIIGRVPLTDPVQPGDTIRIKEKFL